MFFRIGLLAFILLQCSKASAYSVDTTRWATSAIRLNTDAAESHPILSADGRTMYFVRSNHPQNIGEEDKADIWVSYRDSTGTWSNSVNIGAPLNNENENKIVGLSLSAETLYLTGDANDKVFYSKFKNRSWNFPRALEISGISNQSPTLNCHVSLDERFIIFALSNDSCIGKRDLFVSFRNVSEQWSAPRSLGALINTGGDEANVFLAADNRTLYFCTDGRDGLGGLDWYVTRRLDDTWQAWSEPKNLGNAINTAQNDLYFCINTELEECYGIRQNTETDSDITRHFIKNPDFLPLKTILIYGKVQLKNGEPVQTLVELQRLSQNEPENTIASKPDGSFLILLSENDKVGLYALDKNAFSSLAYVNLSQKALKVLDTDTTSNISFFKRDSIHIYNKEKLEIRISQLNLRITDLDKNRPFSKTISEAQFSSILKGENTFEVNQNLEKQRIIYNVKYNKQDIRTATIDDVPTDYDSKSTVPSADDITHTKDTLDRFGQMKKTFSERKREKETPKLPTSTTYAPTPISKEEERRAIEEIGEMHGVVNTNAPEFDALVHGVERKIIEANLIDIKEELQNEFIENWNNWAKLNYSSSEEKRIRLKINDIKKRVKEHFEEKNALERTRNLSEKTFDEDEKMIYKHIKNVVLVNLKTFLKDEIEKEIDFEITFRVHDELRNYLYKNLEKIKNSSRKNNSMATDIKFDNEEDEYYIANEQKTHINIIVYPLKANVSIPLEGIYFKPNSAEILPESNAELSRIQRLVDEDPFQFIELFAYTHSYCGTSFAQSITQQRLFSLKKALIERGIAANHIQIFPNGIAAPLTTNNTIEGRLQNQRIEMKIRSR
jgi:outer membrane protein OmpA-like peptidoglycan-associated protein